MAMIYDVIIVGGGLSGLSTALHLKEFGLSSLVLEKKSYPRYKPCGGGLTGKSIRFLQKLGFDYPSDRINIVEFNLFNQFNNRFQRQNGIIQTIDRTKFDMAFTSFSRQKGVTIREKIQLESLNFSGGIFTIKTSEGQFQSRTIVGADGANSEIRKRFGIRTRQRAMAMTVNGIFNPGKIDRAIFDFGVVEKGYAWLFPHGTSLNAGIYSLQNIHHAKESLQTYLQKYNLTIETPSQKIRSGLIPYGGYGPVNPGVPMLLVGDAAGMADPITGEGIYQALYSGKCAASALNCSLTRPWISYLVFSFKLRSDAVATKIGSRICYNNMNNSLRLLKHEFINRALVEGYASGYDFLRSILFSHYIVAKSYLKNTIQSKFTPHTKNP